MAKRPSKRASGVASSATHPDPPRTIDPATRYALDVAEGRVPAGPYVRDACKRHLRDLEHGPARGLVWDVDAVDRVLGFFRDVLKLNGGAHEGVPFDPLPWQCFTLGSLFGWKRAETGLRRFRMALILTGKGSGKSPLAAGIGLYCLTADKEPRAEVYAAASKKDQAMILFRDAVAMVKQAPALMSRLGFSGGEGKEWNIDYLQTGSFFRPIAAEDGQSGPRPHCGLLDELHEHRDNTVVEMVRAGIKGRRQPLLVGITNAEADRTGVCAQYRDYAGKVCSGALEDDEFFAYVASLDPGDDPLKDESCWAKANPSLGHTFGMEYLRGQVTQARGMPSKEAIVLRLNFCVSTDAVQHWIGQDLWDACQADFDPEELRGLPCWGGLDLSSKRDLTAFAAVWRHPDGRLSAAVWFWRPGDTLEEAAREDNVPYAAWRDLGHLFAPEGRIINKGHVARFVQGFAAEHDMQALAFDTAQMDDFVASCDALGFETWIDDAQAQRAAGLRMVRHGQGFAGFNHSHNLWMPRSIGAVEEAIVDRALTVRANPVLTWNSASAVLDTDPSGNRKWDKRKATGRIDGMVALTMAVGAATAPGAAPARSIWDMEEAWG